VHADPSAPSAAPPAPPEPIAANVPAVDGLPAKQSGPAASRKPAAPRSTADLLAEAFRNQKGGVVACIATHAAEADKTQKLSVKLALTREGKVERVAVYPRDLSGTPMGSCIEHAVRGMRFPQQAQPISFEVPLTARRGS
jgi:hypothetical protein